MKRNPEKALAALIIATGISSVVAQLLIIREYLTQFQGNEYVIALIFFAWLLLGGIGSTLSGLATRRVLKPRFGILILLSFVAAVLPVGELLAIRLFRDVVFTRGASTGFYTTFLFVFVTLGPYGLLVGFLLPYSLAVMRTLDRAFAGSRIYILDNMGDVAGGALFAFVLIYLATPLQAAGLSAMLLALAAAWLSRMSHKIGFFRTVVAMATVIFFLAAGLYAELPSLSPQTGQLAHYQETRHGRLTVVKNREQFTIFTDGVPRSGSLDVIQAEAAVHYPLSQVDNPDDVLIISAGSGMLRELAKYRPSSVDYVELNPEIADIQFRFGLLRTIDGLNVIHQDGRRYLMETDKKYAAVIINTSDPDTFQANRFYTAEFYRLVKQRLKPGGVMGFSIAGYANYISESKLHIISSLYRTVRQSFKQTLLLPGDRVFFICTDGPVFRDIPARLQARGIRTDFIDGYYHGSVTTERVAELRRQLLPDIPLNRDVSPYLMRMMFAQWFEKFAVTPTWLYLGLALLLIPYLLKSSKEEYLLFSTGWMTMGCELTVIFAFQIFFGYIYAQISLIVTVFLGGLLPGAWLGRKLVNTPFKALLLTDGLLICMGLLLALMILPEDARPTVRSVLLAGFCVAFLCGCQFPLALKAGGENSRKTAFAFSADLYGAACGALLTSVLVIPYLGLAGSLAVLIGLKVSSLLVTMLARGRLL